nr:protein ALP1-like [Tanacetum cinerariifolium]
MSSDLFFYISSDDEDEVNSELAMLMKACQAAYEASKQKLQRIPLERDRYDAHDRLVMVYFSEHSQYDEATFRDRFRMSRRLFTKIVQAITDASLFFNKRMIVRDGLGEHRMFHSWQTTCLIKEDNLTDGIYPQWSVLIKSIKNPGMNDHKRILYKTKHEAARKDVERAFGVLKLKWKLIKYPACGMTQKEQHRDDDPIRTHAESMQITQEIVDRTAHLSLKADLVEHI